MNTSAENCERSFPFLNIDHLPVMRLRHGKMVFFEGDVPLHIPFLLNGTAKVYRTTEEGREIMLYYARAGESCSLSMVCALNRTPYPASAQAIEDIEAVLVPIDIFRELMDSSSQARTFAFQTMMSKMQNTIELVEEVAFAPLRRRLARLLLDSLQSDTAKDQVAKTHDNIARELGTSREVVSRTLKELEHEGIVENHRGAILLRSRPQLQKIMEGRDQ